MEHKIQPTRTIIAEDWDYENANYLMNKAEFAEVEWFTLMTQVMIRISEVDKYKVIQHLKERLGAAEYQRFILSYCTVCEAGYDSWIMEAAFEIISENADSAEFQQGFLKSFQTLGREKLQIGTLQMRNRFFSLMRVWFWHDYDSSAKVFTDLGLDVEGHIEIDEQIDSDIMVSNHYDMSNSVAYLKAPHVRIHMHGYPCIRIRVQGTPLYMTSKLNSEGI